MEHLFVKLTWEILSELPAPDRVSPEVYIDRNICVFYRTGEFSPETVLLRILIYTSGDIDDNWFLIDWLPAVVIASHTVRKSLVSGESDWSW